MGPCTPKKDWNIVTYASLFGLFGLCLIFGSCGCFSFRGRLCQIPQRRHSISKGFNSTQSQGHLSFLSHCLAMFFDLSCLSRVHCAYISVKKFDCQSYDQRRGYQAFLRSNVWSCDFFSLISSTALVISSSIACLIRSLLGTQKIISKGN